MNIGEAPSYLENPQIVPSSLNKCLPLVHYASDRYPAGKWNHYQLPEGVAWWIRICVYFSAFIISSILTKLPTPFAVKHPQAIIESLPWLIIGFKHTSSICSLTLLTYCLLFEQKISNFDLSLHSRFLHCSTVHFLCSLANLSCFCLFPCLR